MAFLTAIASAVVGKIAEYTVGPVVRQISYVTSCKRNLQQLEAEVEKLKAARESVANEVDVADRRGERIQPDVQQWLKKVDEITAKADQFFQEERPAELKCFQGGFCGNLKIRHHISRKSTKMVPEVVEVLDEKRGFSAVSCGIRRQEVCSLSTGDYQAFASRTSTLKEIMDELKNPNSKRIGVYGIGGVGKTTLVQQVYRQATEDEKNLFNDVVILLDVKENPNLEEIQKKIVEKLGMKISESEDETMDGRATRLCARMKDKKTLVILDDVWEEIKLEAVGIPSVATCKILLTSRTRKPLVDMSTDTDFALDILEDEESWVLFESKAGDVVKDSAIRTVATQVAKYCRGLPVLVVTIASTLKKRTSLPPWKDALRRLEESNNEELTEKAYLGLEWSYSQLNREELQQFFLLCGIVIRGNKIILRDLLRYGMGLGFLGKLSTLEEARNTVLSLIEELKDFCLLIEDENNECVRMHDLVRDVANRIAFRDHHMFSLVVDGGGRELKEWWDKDFLEKCTIISLPCGNNISRLPKVLQCRTLRMLLLQGNRDYGSIEMRILKQGYRDDDSLTILPTFSEEMKQLNVLALEKMCIPSLPSSLQSLKNVQTLCLERCNLRDITLVGELSKLEILSFAHSKFEKLPKEIAQLTHLRLLDLTNCYQLQVIPPGVISSLTRLEDLRMSNFRKWDVEGEGSNASLLELKHLSRLTSLQINIPDANILPANLFSCFELERYEIFIGCDPWLLLYFRYDGTLNTLEIAGSIQLDKGLEMLLKKSHQLYLKNFVFTCTINQKVVFSSLTTLRVDECHGLRFLFSSSMARSLKELKNLKVQSCRIMEEIVLSTRGEDGEENMVNLFPKLQSLRLKSLPKLVRFCTSNCIEFSSLEELTLSSCDELESFICDPLNSGEKDQEETTLQYSLFNEKVVIPSLTTLRVDECHGLRFLFSSLMARSLVELKNLNVSSCKIMEEIALSTTGEDGKENMDNLFPKLQSLCLKYLPNLVRFCTSSYIEFSSLETLELVNCYELESFICDPPNSGEKNREETALQCSLFDKKVVECRSLETLKIKGWRKLKTIWQNQLVAHQDSFCRLRDVDISECESLINIFPPSIMGRLNALKTIKIIKCKSLEVVFGVIRGSIDDVKAETTHVDTSSSNPFYCHNLDSVMIQYCDSLQNIFPVEGIIGEEAERVIENPPHDHELVSPNVSSLELTGLPKLKSFCTAGMHTSKWPSLKKLEVFTSQVSFLFREKHDQMEPETTYRPVFLIQKVVFPSLTTLRVDGCHGLRFLFSSLMARSLKELKNLEVRSCDNVEEIVLSTRGEDGEENMDNLFPKLQSLRLEYLPKLVRFWTSSYIEFSSLEELELSYCNELESFICDPLNSGEKDREETALQYSLFDKKVVFPNLTTLRVDECHGLRFLFSSLMARSLKELKNLVVSSCKIMEEIVLSTTGEDGKEIMDNLFPKLQSLRLKSLPKLVRFCTSSCIEFSSLETLELVDCYELESFICDPPNNGEKDREETALQYSLFYEKVVGCRSLERLKIVGSRKLKTIWQNQLVAHQDSFCKLRDVYVSKCESLINMFPLSIMGRLNALKTININSCKSLEVVFGVIRGSIDDVKAETAHVDTSSSKPFYCRNLDSVWIDSCDSLQNIFPVAVARGLEQLHKLYVRNCDKLEGIIGEEAEGVTENPPHDHELVFPNVPSLELTGLPKLKSFYTGGIHTSKWPSLKELKVFTSQVFGEKRGQMDPETTERPVFLIQKDSFPQLEQLTLLELESEELELRELTSPAEIWYGDGPSSADFFPKLKSVRFNYWAPFSNQAALLFLDKLPNLEKIEIFFDDSDEIFVGEGSGEIYALPRVRFLTLHSMENLLHLGNQEKSPVPNLQFLELKHCGRLNSLDQSSAIPFRNLTTLKVISCHGLKYLISYSVAKSLVQLKTLQVERCDNIKVIIATDGDDHEIVNFNCTWQYLKLHLLPRLKGFSSGNCIVKFPSLVTFKATENIDLKIDGVQVVQISVMDL